MTKLDSLLLHSDILIKILVIKPFTKYIFTKANMLTYDL